jgi:hypothetical protein
MSLLGCTVCNTDIEFCTCPNRDQLLHDIAYDPEGHVAIKWCRGCDKHYARCKCEEPAFYVILNGKEWDMPVGGYPSLAGAQVPDFNSR